MRRVAREAANRRPPDPLPPAGIPRLGAVLRRLAARFARRHSRNAGVLPGIRRLSEAERRARGSR